MQQNQNLQGQQFRGKKVIKMKCPSCGTTSRIREKDKFCHKCGAKLHTDKEEWNKLDKRIAELEGKV